MLTPHSGNSQNARFTVWHFSRDEQAFSYQTLGELATDGVADRIRKIGYAERAIVGDEAKRVTERDRPVHPAPSEDERSAFISFEGGGEERGRADQRSVECRWICRWSSEVQCRRSARLRSRQLDRARGAHDLIQSRVAR